MRTMQLGFQLYGGSLGLWRIRRTARRPLAVKPRGMACRYVARQNTYYTYYILYIYIMHIMHIIHIIHIIYWSRLSSVLFVLCTNFWCTSRSLTVSENLSTNAFLNFAQDFVYCSWRATAWAEPMRSFLAKTTMWMSDQPHASAISSKSFIHWLTFGRSSPLNFSNESFTSSNVNTVHLGSSCLRWLTTGVTRTLPSWLPRSWFPGPLPSKLSPITPISSSSSSSKLSPLSLSLSSSSSSRAPCSRSKRTAASNRATSSRLLPVNFSRRLLSSFFNSGSRIWATCS